MRNKSSFSQRGMTLVEALVVIALVVMVLTAVTTAVQYSLWLINDSEARMSALSLATNRMEYLRSLPYHDVGTVSGPVFGAVPNTSTTTANDIEFTETVRIFYELDPADDAGGDLNINDYKKVEIEMAWEVRGQPGAVVLTSNIVPVSVETAEGYGAVKVEVRDEATGLPMSGATVNITNDVIGPQDFDVVTGADGVALVAVLAGADYHASATASGYSYDKTYRVTGANPNPSPNSFLVEEALIADRPFRIGELSDLEITAYEDIVEGAASESFTDSSGIVVNTDVQVDTSDEMLELSGAPGSYVANGSAELTRIIPTTLEQWERAVVIADVPLGTSYSVQFYTGECATSCTLVADSDLPGNSSGLTDRFIDLSGLVPSSYPDLTAVVNLQGDTVITPRIDDIAVYYRSSEIESAGTALSMHGDKLIGTSPDLYKINEVLTTDSVGTVNRADLEFDTYTVDSGSERVTRACGDVTFDESIEDINFTHAAGVDSTVELLLESTPVHTVRTVVFAETGELLPGAEVLLERSGFSETVTSDSCGNAFITNTDGNQSDYVVTVTRPGYDDFVSGGFTVDGDTRLRVTMTES